MSIEERNKLSDKSSENKVTGTMNQWVLLSQNARGQWMPQGPFQTSEVLKMLSQKKIKASDYCWQSGWKNWRRIYEISSLYHSRKPPMEFNTVKKESVPEYYFAPEITDSKMRFSEVPEKIRPEKVKVQMLEPWEGSKNSVKPIQKQELVFTDEVPEDLSPDSLKKHFQSEEEVALKAAKPFFSLKRFRTWLFLAMVLLVALVLDFRYQGKVSQFVAPTEVPLKVSYVSVENYKLEHPRHLMVRTDLQKGSNLVVRLLNMDETPMATIKGGAGLVIPSRGQGRMRIPLYPYELKPGFSYKVLVQAEGVEVLKTFYIPLKSKAEKE